MPSASEKGILEVNDVGKSKVIIQLLNNVGKALTQCSKTSSLFNKKSKVSSSADCYTSGHYYQLIILLLFIPHRSSPKGVRSSHQFHMRMRNKKRDAGLFRCLQSNMKDINKEKVWMLDTCKVNSDQKHAFHMQVKPIELARVALNLNPLISYF